MQQPLQLNKEEKLRFMRALYSIFVHDKHVNSTERAVLHLLNQCFDISTSDYQHYVHIKVADIAKEINAIRDVRVRVYFMRIIHDTYREEILGMWKMNQDLIEGIQGFFNGPTTDHAKKFKTMYAFLQESIDLEGGRFCLGKLLLQCKLCRNHYNLLKKKNALYVCTLFGFYS